MGVVTRTAKPDLDPETRRWFGRPPFDSTPGRGGQYEWEPVSSNQMFPTRDSTNYAGGTRVDATFTNLAL
jgi:hypothetical protein